MRRNKSTRFFSAVLDMQESKAAGELKRIHIDKDRGSGIQKRSWHRPGILTLAIENRLLLKFTSHRIEAKSRRKDPGLTAVEFQSIEHKDQVLIPGREGQIAEQGFHILEKVRPLLRFKLRGCSRKEARGVKNTEKAPMPASTL